MSDVTWSRRLRELLAQSARTVRAARQTCALARRACGRARQAGGREAEAPRGWNARANPKGPRPGTFPSRPRRGSLTAMTHAIPLQLAVAFASDATPPPDAPPTPNRPLCG